MKAANANTRNDMRYEYLQHGLRSGVILGVINIFLLLIGFEIIASRIIASSLSLTVDPEASYNLSLLIFFGLVALGFGAYSAKEAEHHTWAQVLFNGLITGLVGGLLLGIVTYIIGIFYTAGIDLRGYLAQMSPDNINFFLHGDNPLRGLLINLTAIIAGALLGAALTRLIMQSHLKQRYNIWRRNASSAVNRTPLARYLNRHTVLARYLLYGALLLVVFGLPLFVGDYWNYILGTVGIYVLMGLGLNIVVGLAGLLDLGYVAFFAIGAYTIGLLTAPEPLGLMWNFWLVLPLAVLFGALGGILLGIPVLRLRGDYLAIVTLGFGEIIRVLVKSDLLAPVLGGPQGVRDIAGPTLFGIDLNGELAFLYFITLGILLVIFVTVRLQDSRTGRAWIAMREDETVAQAMGINTYKSKLMAFAIGAAFAGLGGVLFASRNQYTGPEDHSLLVSINVLSVVIVGGMGSIPGVILGAFALKGLPEILRQVEDYRILAFGGLLVAMMIWRPEGLWPARRRRMEVQREPDTEPPEIVHPKSDQVPASGLTSTTDVPISTSPSPDVRE